MPNVNIDGKEYDIDQLSDKAKANIASLQFVQGEIQRLNNLIAIAKTAEVAYTNVLKEEIESM
tara:strand:- start:84 stop:272 length:189 start_codon:yes stop_codon:yes gene_type:complete